MSRHAIGRLKTLEERSPVWSLKLYRIFAYFWPEFDKGDARKKTNILQI
jgi:hypothetical protein